MPVRAKNDSDTAAMLMAYPRLRNKLTSKLGWSLRYSMYKNSAMTAIPATIGMRTIASIHVRVSDAWMIPYTNNTSPTIDRTSPSTSNFRPSGFRVSGTTLQMAIKPTVTIGTLIKKTDPQAFPVSGANHCGFCSNAPPRTGPRATAAPTAPAQVPIARPRS